MLIPHLSKPVISRYKEIVADDAVLMPEPSALFCSISLVERDKNE